MSRTLLKVALTGALLIALHTTGALANVAMDPDPAMGLTWTPTAANPGNALILLFGPGTYLYYTVTDHDTFTPGPPPMPPPPYNGPASHDDNVNMVDFDTSEGSAGILQCSVSGPSWTHEAQYNVFVRNVNDTGAVQYVSFALKWDDQALGPMGVPPNQVTGSANDIAQIEFTKLLVLMDY